MSYIKQRLIPPWKVPHPYIRKNFIILILLEYQTKIFITWNFSLRQSEKNYRAFYLKPSLIKAGICSLLFHAAKNLLLNRTYTDTLNNGVIKCNSQRKLINYLSKREKEENSITRKSNCQSITMTAYSEILINPTSEKSPKSQLFRKSNFPHVPRNTISHSNYFPPAKNQQLSSLLTVHSSNQLNFLCG